MFISECPIPKIEPTDHLEWVNKTENKSPLPYNTTLEYECMAGYGFHKNATNHTINTVKCEDSATFGDFKKCITKGMECS